MTETMQITGGRVLEIAPDNPRQEISPLNPGVFNPREQPLPRGEVFIYSGNAPGTNAWLVVLKRLE